MRFHLPFATSAAASAAGQRPARRLRTGRSPLRSKPAALAFVAVPLLGIAASPVASAHPTPRHDSCSVTWGSLAKKDLRYGATTLTNVRSGRHSCFDRLVFDLSGPVTGYRVRYVDEVRQDGSGHVVPLRGGARIRIILLAPAYDEDHGPTYDPDNPRELVAVSGYDTFRQVAWAGSFEGQTTIGLGVRARLPMRVFLLDGPGNGSRVVVDVAHRW